MSDISPLPTPIRVMRIIARLNVGGPTIHVSLLAAHLPADRFETQLVTGQVGADEGDMSYFARSLNVEPMILSTMRREIHPLADIKTLWELIQLMRTFRPHVVHTHTAKAGFVGRFAAWLMRVPLIVHTFHGHVFHGYFGPLKTRLFITLEQTSAAMSDVILTISPGLKDELIAYGITGEEKIRVIPLGLPLESFRDVGSLRGRLRQEFDLPEQKQLVGIVGRLVPVKNHDLFFAAAQQVHDRLPDAHFVIVGDGERRRDLESMAAERLPQDAYTFTGWRDDLATIYADLDALIISSHNEGTPVSIIEAMAAGVPVVATRVGGIPDLLQEGLLGQLVPADDAQAMADAIITVLDTPAAKAADIAEQVGQARATAFDRYSSERLMKNMQVLYLDLLAKKLNTP